MSEPEGAIVQTRLSDHPAVRAWRKLEGDRARPHAIQVLKEDQHDVRCDLYEVPPQGTGRSAVYRLLGAGPAGESVVAKQGESGATERVIYETVLPHLPISTLRYYGSVADNDTASYWLFMEDGGDENYSPETPEHRAIAGQWLGAMNQAARRLTVADTLPDRGPAFYLEGLRRARTMIAKILGHPALVAGQRTTLESIVRHCDQLETHWPRIARFCARMPSTLVHGDLATRNVRVRIDEAGSRLLVMDWETAGWGIPAADLTQFALESLTPDITSYWSVVQPSWPQLDLTYLRELVDVGRIFRVIAALSWANDGFHPHSVEWYMEDMRWYELELWDWLRTGSLLA